MQPKPECKNETYVEKQVPLTVEKMSTINSDIFPFFETIRVDNGSIQNLNLHLKRMHETCSEAYGNFLHENIFDGIQLPENGIHRLNIWYNGVDTEIKISLYEPVPINTVALISCEPDFDYRRKYTNRDVLNNLLKSAPGADEIIIVKKGMITDTSKANIVFEKNGKYYTPDTFLLNGTMRQFLLKEGKMIEKAICKADICSYEKIYFINALNPIETAPSVFYKEIIGI